MLRLQSAESPVFRVPESSFFCVRSRGLVTARTFSGASDFLAKFHDYGLGVIIITFGQHPLTFVCGSNASPINSVLLSLLLACLLLQVHSASFPRIGLSVKSSRFSRCQAGSGRLRIIGQLYVSTTSKYVTEVPGVQFDSTVLF